MTPQYSAHVELPLEDKHRPSVAQKPIPGVARHLSHFSTSGDGHMDGDAMQPGPLLPPHSRLHISRESEHESLTAQKKPFDDDVQSVHLDAATSEQPTVTIRAPTRSMGGEK